MEGRRTGLENEFCLFSSCRDSYHRRLLYNKLSELQRATPRYKTQPKMTLTTLPTHPEILAHFGHDTARFMVWCISIITIRGQSVTCLLLVSMRTGHSNRRRPCVAQVVEGARLSWSLELGERLERGGGRSKSGKTNYICRGGFCKCLLVWHHVAGHVGSGSLCCAFGTWDGPLYVVWGPECAF